MSVAGLAGMINPQHDNALAVKTVLKDVSGAENLQDDLAIFLATGDRPAETRMLAQNLNLGNDFGRDPGRK